VISLWVGRACRRRRQECPRHKAGCIIERMVKLALTFLSVMMVAMAVDLPSKKFLDLAAIKAMVAAAEGEAKARNVQVTICIMDESGNILFLQKADGAGLNTIQFAQKKAKYAALYGRPSKAAADTLASGNLQILAFPDGFPNQGGLPVKVDGRTIGSVACSGAASEVDEAISQVAIDAILKK
jgi:glc operon protein GlcG